MVHDLVAFAASAARNGLTSVVVAVNEDLYATAGSRAQLIPRGNGKVIMYGVVSEAIANFIQSRFHFLTDDKWNVSDTNARDQTGAFTPSCPGKLSYKFTKDDYLVLESNNNNNAQLETHLLWITYDNDVLSTNPPKLPDSKIMLVRATGAATLTADVWTKVTTLTFTNHPFKAQKQYKIHGMAASGATMHAARLQFTGNSPDIGRRPGVMGGDTATPDVEQMIYGDFGTFEGASPPGAEAIGSAGDTAQQFLFLIEEL